MRLACDRERSSDPTGFPTKLPGARGAAPVFRLLQAGTGPPTVLVFHDLDTKVLRPALQVLGKDITDVERSCPSRTHYPHGSWR